MERHIISALILALGIPCSLLGAPTAPAPKEPSVVEKAFDDDSIFAPYPSHVRIGTRSDGILITWRDGGNAVDGFAVYRSECPIDRDTFQQALKLATLPVDAREYLDKPESPSPFYYAILGLSKEGAVYEVFIPLKNVSIAPVAFLGAPAPEPKAAPPAPVEPPPLVSAESFKDGIRLTWSPIREGRRVILYRSTSPMLSLTDLLNASWVANVDGPKDSLTDYPVPGIEYYYALVDDEALRNGNPVLEKGKNATDQSVTIPVGLYRIGLPAIPPASRSLPLPYLALTREVGTGGAALPEGYSLPSPVRIQPETEKVLKNILKLGTPRTDSPRDLVIFPGDTKGGSSGGEEYTLHLIISQRLATRDWKGAANELARYLSLNRSPAIAARAHFYRGEALSFLGSYQEAFFEFLQAQNTFYAESNQWIDWLLNQMPAAADSGK